MMLLKLECGDYSIFVEMPEKFDDLEAGMLHVEGALRRLFERHGMITTYEERMKEIGHRPDAITKMGIERARSRRD